MHNVVLITGAGRRVGLHMAQRLHQDGYTVLAHYRSMTAGVQDLIDAGITTIQADLDNVEAIKGFIEQVEQQCDSVRAVIHNASCFAPTPDDFEQAIADYQRYFQVHMLAPWMINDRISRLMNGSKQQPADIIHITDINAENPTPKFDIYGTTKAGLHNMTLALAKKYAPEIKVNAVAPGPVLFSEAHSDEVVEQTLAETLLAKEGGAEPVYQAVKSLLENPFITGASLAVDGGRRLSKR